jgi:toxin ParE1/3/4
VKRVRLLRQARADRQNEIRYYRREAGEQVANRLIDAFQAGLRRLAEQPAIGSPTLGHELGIENLRTWEVSDFPLVLIYIERANHVDVVRVLGRRQNIASLIRTVLT